MKHIDLMAQEEAVKQFFLELPADPDGWVVESEGRIVARVTPVTATPAGACVENQAWNEAKNARRCELVDRQIEGALLPEETVELAVLQQQMLDERRRLAPMPLDDLRRLHQELLGKAQRAGETGR